MLLSEARDFILFTALSPEPSLCLWGTQATFDKLLNALMMDFLKISGKYNVIYS